jgi:hypothetical protein
MDMGTKLNTMEIITTTSGKGSQPQPKGGSG